MGYRRQGVAVRCTKWLNKMFRALPRFAGGMAPLIDAIAAESNMRKNVFQMIELNYMIADAIADLGLARKPTRAAFDEGPD